MRCLSFNFGGKWKTHCEHASLVIPQSILNKNHFRSFQIIAVVGGCQVAGMFISYGLKMDKIKEFHQKLHEIIEGNDQGIGRFFSIFDARKD